MDLEVLHGEVSGYGVAAGDLVALVVTGSDSGSDSEVMVGVAAAVAGGVRSSGAVGSAEQVAAVVGAFDRERRPRWGVWSAGDVVRWLDRSGVRLERTWDIAEVHRLEGGGFRADPARAWARTHGLDPGSVPGPATDDLFSHLDDHGDPAEPIRTDGHLRSGWLDDAASPGRVARWAELALEVASLQQDSVTAWSAPMARSIVHSESTAALLAVELSLDGLPFDRAVAEEIIGASAGPRPGSAAEDEAIRAARDAHVLAHVPGGARFDLRSPEQVRSMLRRCGVEVPDTRAGRLRRIADQHPVVGALLAWRKAERIATTFGYDWIDAHVGPDGRLRGEWTTCDGAAGRMTASAGLHNMPSEMRPAVRADAHSVFVRVDLGQIEPRVLAVVSGDPDLARATASTDLYTDVAEQLGVSRDIAKVAMLGAMYGQTTGRGAEALARMRHRYPVAMAFLDEADHQGRVGHDVFTHGGRRIRLGNQGDLSLPERDARARAAARGRYARNAVIQGAAAEFFKMWAVTVRAALAGSEAGVVLCLHDELLVHAPASTAADVATTMTDALEQTARRWSPDGAVRFVGDAVPMARWSDAKD